MPSASSFVLERALDRLGSIEIAGKGKSSFLWRIVAQPIPPEGIASPQIRAIVPSPNPRNFIRFPLPLPSPLPPPFPVLRQNRKSLRTHTGEYATALDVVFSLINDDLFASGSSSSPAASISGESSAAVTRKMIKKVQCDAITELSCNLYGHGSASLDIAFERALHERGLIRREELDLYSKASSRLLFCPLEVEATSFDDDAKLQAEEQVVVVLNATSTKESEEICTLKQEILLNNDATSEASSSIVSSSTSISTSLQKSETEVEKIEESVITPLVEVLIKESIKVSADVTDEALSPSLSSPVSLVMISTDAITPILPTTEEIITPEKEKRRNYNNNTSSSSSSNNSFSSSSLEDEVDSFEPVYPQIFSKKALFSVAKEDSLLPSKPIPTRYHVHVWGAKDDIDEVLKMAGWELARHAHHRVYKRDILFPDGTKKEQTFVRPVASGHDRMKDRSMHKDLKKREDEALDAFNIILDNMTKSSSRKKNSSGKAVAIGSKKV
jgi:hypothetical protein